MDFTVLLFSATEKKKTILLVKLNLVIFFVRISIHHNIGEKKDSEVYTLELSKDLEVYTIDSLIKENVEFTDKVSKLRSHYVKRFEFAKKNSKSLT